MHAIIITGGDDEQLRPITCTMSQPLMPLLGKSVIEYIVALAARHGARVVHAAVSDTEKLEALFGDGSAYGVAMQYHAQKTPLGTAGSVYEAAKAIRETFVVLRGDCVTDCDLTQAIAFHRRKGAMATLILKKQEATPQLGGIETDENGRVKRLVEKSEQTDGEFADTGMVILEPEVLRFIPQGRVYAFEELFSRLIAQGLPVYGWTMQGYWRDMDDVEAYVGVCADALDGKVNLDALWEADEQGNRIAPDAKVSAFAKVIAPCFIGSGAQIGPGAIVGPHAVIGTHVRVQREARVKRSVIFDHARIGAGAQISGAVVAESAQVGTACALREGCVLGTEAVLEETVSLSRGARVWPQKRIEAGRSITQDVVWGDCRHIRIRDGAATCENLQEALEAACAWARVSGAKTAAIMHDGGNRAKLFAHGAATQLGAAGVACLELGSGSEPMLRVQARLLRAEMAIFFQKRQVIFLDAQQCLPSCAQQRLMELGHGELRQHDAPIQPKRLRGVTQYYLAHLCSAADEKALAQMQPYGVIACPKKAQEKTVRALLARLGLENMRVQAGKKVQVQSYETGFFLSEDGKSVRIADSRGIFSAQQTYLLGVMALSDRGETKILLSGEALPAAQALCRAGNVAFERVQGDRNAWKRALSMDPVQQDFAEDGLFAFVCLLSCFVSARTIPRALLETHVHEAFCEQEIPCGQAGSMRVISALSKEWNTSNTHGTIETTSQDGSALLCVSGNGSGIRVMTQARDTEAARELCGALMEKVRTKMEEMSGNVSRE